MKKLSFFLMAMLISLVSFAQDAAYKTALFGASYNSKKISSYTDTWTATNDGFTVTIVNANNNNNGWNYIKMGRKNNASVGSITTKEAIDKPVSAVTLTIDAITANKINSLTLKTSTDGTTYTEAGTFSKAKGDQTVELTAPAANLYYQIVADCASGSSNGLITISKVQYFASEGGEQGPTVAAPVFDVTEPAFKEAFTLTITSEEGTTLKYTTDNTDPITSATAIEVATNTATVAIPAKSTVVKAVAIKDELTSKVKSVTYGFVNTPETAYTVSEAIDVINAGLGLDNELYAKGEIYKIDSYNSTYKSITYWIKDEAGKQLQVYSGRGLNNTDFASKDDLVIGTKVVICGLLKKYNSTYEFDKTNYIVSLELPVVNHTITVSANPAEAGTVTGGGEFEETDEITVKAVANDGYEFVNWTENEEEVSTDAEYTFAVLADRALVANFEKTAPTTETIYFINAKKWAKVNVYAWTTDPIVAWPGAAATKEAEQIAGYDVYSYTLNAGAAANVIFNDGSSQTPDLVWTAGKYYVIDMGWLTKEEAETKLAAPLPETWNIVGAAGLMGKDWDLNAAENAMTKQEDGTYKLEKKGITIVAGTYEYKAAKDHGWTVAVPQDGNQKLKITTSGIYDVTFVLDVTAKKLTATATLKQAAVVIPTIVIAGDMNSWSQTKDKFTMSADSLTATFKATLAVKNYGFKMIVGGAWHSDGKTITRAANSTKFTGANSNTNSTLKADIAGEYLFTWEYATKTLTVTYPALPVKYNVTVTATAEGEDVVTGGGEYAAGEKVTVTASEELDGWVFIGWKEDGEFVANDPEYTFVVDGDVELVAVYAMDLGENEVTDLVIDGDNMLLTGSIAGFPMGTMNLELALGEYDEEEGVFLLTEESKLYIGETNLTFVDGMAAVDMNTNSAMAIVVFELDEAYYYMTINMSAAPAEPVDLVVTDATIYEENGILLLTAPWEGKTIKAELPATEHQGWMMIEIHEGEDFSIAMSQNATIATVDNVLTITGVFTDNFTGDVYNVTISGKLPVVEPEVITYELNGGVLPAPAVPTNAELWGTDTADVNGLMHYFNHYYNLKRSAQDISAAVSTNPVATFLTGMPDDAGIFVDEESKYKWLGDYIVKVTNDQIAEGKLSVLTDVNTNIKWRYGVQAFFMCLPATDSNYKGWADFTEAGKPENWGPAYQAANALVLPTEPVAEDYVLPTPTKEGYKFVGWYDNAAGAGDAYTVIPAGWSGTLYAIWEVEGPGTALENIAVEGKAVKAIINGQLIIIKNGVQYNAQGQVVK